MRKFRIQVVVAILSGLNTAGSLIFSARAVLPDWPWQWHSLIGFFVFAGIMGWIIADKQSEVNNLRSGKPELTIGRQARIKRVFDERKSEIELELRLFFKNIGKKAAYRFRCSVGYAPESDVSNFKLIGETTNVNRIDINNDFDTVLGIKGFVKYSKKDGVEEIPSSKAFIHCMVSYSDSEYNERLYKKEWWFSYRADTDYLGVMSDEEKSLMEPYVRKAYGD